MVRMLLSVVILLTSLVVFCMAEGKFSILVIHSYHQGLSWTDSQMRGIKDNLSSTDFEIYVEYLDAKRFQGDEFFNRKLASIIKKYQGKIHIDLAVATDDYALVYAIKSKRYSQFFADMPIVFSGVNFYHDSIKQDYPNITGVVESYDLISTVEAILNIQQGVERITVINDLTITGHHNLPQINSMVSYFKNELNFIVHNDYSIDELVKNLSVLAYPKDAVLLLSMNRDNRGRYFEFEDASRFVSSSCTVPVYGVWDFYLNNGLTGGKITSGYEQGKSVANLIKEILVEQVPASEIPVIKKSPNKYIFDYNHLAKFNIDVSLLPLEAVVLNQPDPFLLRHKTMIKYFLVFIVFQFFAIIALTLVNRIFRKRNKKFYEGNKRLFQKILENSTLFESIRHGLDGRSLEIHGDSLEMNNSLELFEKVFEKSAVGYIVFNKSFEILNVNDNALAILGYNSKDHIMSRDIRRYLVDLPENMLLEGALETECEVNGLENRVLYCKVYFSSIASTEGTLRLAVLRNITGERENIVRLESSKTQLENRYDDAIKELNETNRKLIFEINEGIVKQKELFSTREKLKKIVDTIDSIIVVVNSTFDVVSYNLKAQKLSSFDISNQAVRAKNFEQCYKKYGAKNIHIEQAIKESRAFHINSHVCVVEGKNVFVDLSFFPMPSYSGKLDEVLVKIDDITEKINFQKMIFHSEKMMSVGNLAAGMAHEINNPLGGILQGTQNIERRLLPDLEKNIEVAKKHNISLESLQGYLEDRKIFYFLSGVKESGEKAAEIIRSLLKFSLSMDDKKDFTNLNELCAQSVELANSDYNLKQKFSIREINFIQNYQENAKKIYCNSNEIKLVLLGLIKNSVYAIRKKGKTVGFVDTPFIKLETQYTEFFAHIYVEDNGCGVDENVATRIFEPFFTTSPVGDGTGLGLSVAYSVITHGHKGNIELKKSGDGNTVFKISLPY